MAVVCVEVTFHSAEDLWGRRTIRIGNPAGGETLCVFASHIVDSDIARRYGEHVLWLMNQSNKKELPK